MLEKTAVLDPTTATPTSDSWEGRLYGIPEHGKTYYIVEAASGRSITITGYAGAQTLGLMTTSECNNASKQHWHCFEKDGFLGFQNSACGKFLGYDGKWNGGNCGMRIESGELRLWEYFIPRLHPRGGYQLLSPQDTHRLNVLCVCGDGKTLEVRQNGLTMWKFVEA